MNKKIKVAIIGSGNIGADLLIKVNRSEHLECGAFIGRSLNSQGLMMAQKLGVRTSAQGIDYIINNPDCCDIVFDATSASAHIVHAPILASMNKFVVDLTPAKIGKMCVPAVNLDECLDEKNVNMVTCGGQASTPIAYAIGQTQKDVDYIEVVSSIASRSAGPATRVNLDEYIHTTESAVKLFSGAARTKAILNLNPAVPPIIMQTTIMAKVASPDLEKLRPFLNAIVAKVKSYVPDFEVKVGPIVENGRIVIILSVKGQGDYLPEYAGNLDIINCAAIGVAERWASEQLEQKIKNPGGLYQ